MIALYRSGRHLRQVKLVPAERAEELLAFAMHGDTLHQVPSEMCSEASDVMRCVENQLERGEFQVV